MNLCSRCVQCCKLSCLSPQLDDDEPKAQLVLPNPFIGVSDKRYLITNEELEVDVYKALDVIVQKPQLEFSPRTGFLADDELPSSEDSDDYVPIFESSATCLRRPFITGSMIHVRSLENLKNLSPSQDCPVKVYKCQSLTSLNVNPAVDQTVAKLTLDYDESSEKLSVLIHEILRVPSKGQYVPIVVTLKVLPSMKGSFQSKPVVSCEDAIIGETFVIKNLTMETLKKSTFRLAVFLRETRRRSSLSMKDSFLCEGFLKGSDVNWSAIHKEDVEIFLKRKWLKKQSTSDKYLQSYLGELFVLLQYSPAANRMKVLVRKANNLPRSDKLIGHPGHSVLINLRENEDIVDSQETRVQDGLCAVWNQPFLFTIPNDNTTSYSLEFVIMRSRRYTKNDVVGHVIIGPNAPKSGVDHWSDTMRPRGLECALWHNIVPLFTYKK